MKKFDRIVLNSDIMGGKPTIRGTRVTVGMLVNLVASKHSEEEILELYPYLEQDDITQALQYAAWRADELELPLDTV